MLRPLLVTVIGWVVIVGMTVLLVSVSVEFLSFAVQLWRLPGSRVGAETLAAVAAAQAEGGDRTAAAKTFKHAVRTAGAIPDPRSQADALRLVAVNQARAGDRSGAASTFDRAVQAAVRITTSRKSSTLAAIAVAQAETGYGARARQTAAFLEGEDGQRTLLKIAEAQTIAGDVAEARRTVAEMGYQKYRARGLTALARAQAQAGDVTGAHETAAAIPDHDQKVRAFWTIAETQDRAGAAKTLERALQIAASLWGAEPKAWALQGIAKAQAQAGDLAAAGKTLEEAIRTAATIPEADSRAWFLRRIGEAQAEAGDQAAAAKTLERAFQAATRSEARNKALALRDIVIAQARIGDLAGARQTFAALPKAWLGTKALAAIAEAEARAGARAAAARTFEHIRAVAIRISDPRLRTDELRSLAEAQARVGARAAAAKTFALAARSARGIPHVSGKVQLLREIAPAQAKVGDGAGARQTAAMVPDAWSRVALLGAIAFEQAQAGDRAGAAETFDEAFEVAASSGELLGAVAVAQAKAGDVVGARETAAGITDALDRARAVSFIAEAQIEAGNRAAGIKSLEQAFQVASSSDDRSRAGLLGVIAVAQAKAGDGAGARRTAAAIRAALTAVAFEDDKRRLETPVLTWLKGVLSLLLLAVGRYFLRLRPWARVALEMVLVAMFVVLALWLPTILAVATVPVVVAVLIVVLALLVTYAILRAPTVKQAFGQGADAREERRISDGQTRHPALVPQHESVGVRVGPVHQEADRAERMRRAFLSPIRWWRRDPWVTWWGITLLGPMGVALWALLWARGSDSDLLLLAFAIVAAVWVASFVQGVRVASRRSKIGAGLLVGALMIGAALWMTLVMRANHDSAAWRTTQARAHTRSIASALRMYAAHCGGYPGQAADACTPAGAWDARGAGLTVVQTNSKGEKAGPWLGRTPAPPLGWNLYRVVYPSGAFIVIATPTNGDNDGRSVTAR